MFCNRQISVTKDSTPRLGSRGPHRVLPVASDSPRRGSVGPSHDTRIDFCECAPLGHGLYTDLSLILRLLPAPVLSRALLPCSPFPEVRSAAHTGQSGADRREWHRFTEGQTCHPGPDSVLALVFWSTQKKATRYV